ncbi:MAG: hypothetical protein WBD34_13930 [Burkholderiaceae bacterium]
MSQIIRPVNSRYNNGHQGRRSGAWPTSGRAPDEPQSTRFWALEPAAPQVAEKND